MARVKASGLGGLVCNVAFDNYLRSDEHWATLEQAVESCKQAGLIVWIYDEKGYPSGTAGGEVLKKNPAFEAQALTFDPSQSEPFAVRPAFEYAHASNNYFACRRCPNIMDAAAMGCFIETTHDAYAQHLGRYFGTTIRAFFTDEPSLMGVNIGMLPENVRKSVPVVDPVDPTVKSLPMVPWVSDLPQLYQQRYGENLMAKRRDLFDPKGDPTTRTRFWSLVADLVRDRYFGQIQAWCRAHHVASSGHTLHEEQPIAQVALAGDSLADLGRMDIPGLDVLTSDPHAVIDGMWLTAELPVSAALLNGRRLVMTETSDFAQTMATGRRASLEMMQATAAWQAALGVTEFTLYYDAIWRLCNQLPHQTERETRHPYAEYVGRLNALLRDARPETGVLLYYPIRELQELYQPVDGPITLESQCPRAREIVASLNRLGRGLLTRQIPFLLIDEAMLDKAKVKKGHIEIGDLRFAALVLPTGEKVSAESATISQFSTAGGIVLRDGASPNQPLDLSKLAGLCKTGQLAPPSPDIVVGRFDRDGRHILLLVNTTAQPYTGSITTGDLTSCTQADPATGKIVSGLRPDNGRLAIQLAGQSALFLISDAAVKN